MSPPLKRGILLFAHGARDPNWARPFEAVLAHLRKQAQEHDQAVALSYLEFMQPTLPEAATDLIAQGCTELTLVPLFLGAGGHVRKDVPALAAAIAAQHPHVNLQISPAVGETEILIQALAESAWTLAQPT